MGKYKGFQRNSLSPRIMELYGQRLRVSEIAKVVGCSHVNVHKTIKRHAVDPIPLTPRGIGIAPLAKDDHLWLKEEAARVGVPMRDLARAMLIDAIMEARDGRN